MMIDNWVAISGIITGLLGTGYFASFFTKKKYQLELEKMKSEVNQANKTAETTDIENSTKVVDLYKSALDDLNARYELKYKQLQEISANIEGLFKKKEDVLEKEIEYHKKQTALYKKMYEDKVREFNNYKKLHP